MWVRSEFGVLCNLSQANEVTLENGTVEAHYGQLTRPLAHRASEAEAIKLFDRIAQELADGKRFLDLRKKHIGEPSSNAEEPLSPAESGDDDKAL